MDCTCNCFGVATAARVPVKRYNLLVPDVFPVVEPPFERPLGITIERKIKKLADYLDKNEFRAPKVSRRLQRRLHKELGAGHYGYVKLAVETYAHLLASFRPEKSGLLANELVVRTVVKRRKFVVAGPRQLLAFREAQQGSVVGLLLAHPLPALRLLGVELLTSFIKCQQTSDYVPQLEAFVPLLCDNARPRAQQASAAAAAAGDAAAGAAAAAEADRWACLRAACLRALLEHLRFCARLSYVSYHLHTITFTVLECVEASGQGLPQGGYASPRAELEVPAGEALAALAAAPGIARGSISSAVAASPPALAALLVFEELAHMTRDAAEGKKVLEFVMRFLDGRGRWLGTPVMQTAVAVLRHACEQEHQRYLLFSSLMRHAAAAEALTPAERGAVLRLAVAESAGLERPLAAPALLLALRELPAVVAGGGGAQREVPPMPPMPSLPPPLPPGAAPAGQRELEPAAVGTGRAAAAGGVGDAASLQSHVLAAVEQLARRVEDGGQLLEAVGSTVGKLRGGAPTATAALQCCVAAARAGQYASPKEARRPSRAPRTFPSLLLHELAGISAGWEAQQRLLAHQLLLQLLPCAADGLKEQHAELLLSAVWHEAALADNRPAAFPAMERWLVAVLAAAPAAALPQVLRLAGSLQLEVLLAGGGGAAAGGAAESGGGRLGQLSAAQCCALLCVCDSVLHALASQLGQQAVLQLAVSGCDGPLRQLALAPSQGLVLRGAAADGGSPEATAKQQQQQFWQGSAVLLAFAEGEQERAANFLAGWRRSSSAEERQAALGVALAGLPLFQQNGGAGSALFQPLPIETLTPRLMQAGAAAPVNGSVAAVAAGSRRVERLRSMYRHMRQISLCDADRAELATLSQETAAEEQPVATLQMRGLVLPWLDGGGGGAQPGGGSPSVDDVLAEVDGALHAAEQAIRQGRSPSPPAWHSAAGGSSGSLDGSAPAHQPAGRVAVLA